MLSHSVKHKWLLVCEILTLWEAVEELGLNMGIADSHLPSHQGRAANYWKWNFTYSWTVISSLASFIFLTLDKRLQLNSCKLNVGVGSCTCIISFNLYNNLTRSIGSSYYFPHVIPYRNRTVRLRNLPKVTWRQVGYPARRPREERGKGNSNTGAQALCPFAHVRGHNSFSVSWPLDGTIVKRTSWFYSLNSLNCSPSYFLPCVILALL